MHFKELTSPYLKELTLLCVEDSKTIRGIYKNLFSPLFKKLMFAFDGKEALNLFYEADIIITDYNMPVMDGLEMVSIIRQVDQNIPIILVTAFENLDVLRNSIQLGVNNFVKKPFEPADIFSAINSAVHLVMGHKYLLQKQKNQITELREKEKYSNYQEELSFKKELSLIKNDFYYCLSTQEITDRFHISDFLYKPLDTMSGDLYSARQLNDSQELYFLVDGMGKGISASVSAILFTSFFNYVVDRALEYKKVFGMDRLLSGSISYINKYLLEDEVLAASFVLIDVKNMHVEYASFGMPAILYMDKEFKVHSLCSNNPPIHQYTKKANTSKFSLDGVVKILISSDGIFENRTKNINETYAKFIKKDFQASMTGEDFYQRMKKKINIQEDDMTFIFLHQIQLNKKIAHTSINARLNEIEDLNIWYESKVSFLTNNISIITKASLSFTELMMNAYEHGSLGISRIKKHQLIEDDKYIQYLKHTECQMNKKIDVSIYELKSPLGESCMLTKIEDNGSGFNTNIFSEIFGFHKSFNGRGVFIAKKASIGIYYNYKGNVVYFFNKI